MQVEFGSVFQFPHKVHFEVGKFQKIEVVQLFLHCIRYFSFDHFILNKYFTDWLLLFIKDIHFTRQTALVRTVEFNANYGFPETHWLCYLVFGEMDCLTLF